MEARRQMADGGLPPAAPRRAAARLTVALLLPLLTSLSACIDSPPAGQEVTVRYSRQVAGPESFEAARPGESTRVLVRFGAGRLTLSGASSDQLYSAIIQYHEGTQVPIHDYVDGQLTVGVERTSSWRGWGPSPDAATMELALSTRVPLELEFEVGAARAALDLGGLHLRNLTYQAGATETELRVSRPNPGEMDRATLRTGAAALRARELGNLNAGTLVLESGAGDTHLDFTGLRRPETHVTVRAAVGRVEITFPAEVGVRMTRRAALSSLEAPGFEDRGELLQSSNWDTASVRVVLDVEMALGSLSVGHLEP